MRSRELPSGSIAEEEKAMLFARNWSSRFLFVCWSFSPVFDCQKETDPESKCSQTQQHVLPEQSRRNKSKKRRILLLQSVCQTSSCFCVHPTSSRHNVRSCNTDKSTWQNAWRRQSALQWNKPLDLTQKSCPSKCSELDSNNCRSHIDKPATELSLHEFWWVELRIFTRRERLAPGETATCKAVHCEEGFLEYLLQLGSSAS